MASDFVHLHVHSHYSLLEALPKVKPLLRHVKKHGMDAVALTDNGVMYGIIEFYQKAKDAEVKPIIGMDAYMAPRTRFDKQHKIDTKPYRLVLLAENNTGYKNLMELSSTGWLEGFYYKPRLDKDLLRRYCQGKDHGLIALSGGVYSEIATLIRSENVEKAKKVIKEFVEIFGKDNFYLELVDRPEIPEQKAVNATMIELSKELDVPLVVTKDSYYLEPSDREAQIMLGCIKSGKRLEEEKMRQVEYDASLCSPKDIIERFKDVPEAIANTKIIADRCNVELDLGKWNFANIEIPEGYTAQEWLKERAYKEIINKIKGDVTEEMKERIDYELKIIKHKGFAPYFLIVSDYIEWARANGIVTTTRGSAAGSLVSFAIGISTVNPIDYKLPFERFLNPERPSAPDVDGDFADNRREEMIEYVSEKYGKNKVAQICTFGTMLARGSVRDVGRSLGFPYSQCDQIAKMIPPGSQGFPMTLERAIKENPELKKQYQSNAQIRRLIDLAMQIEGCSRHVSIHAAGIVFSPTDLTDFTPIQIDTREGKVLTQYEMKSVEAAGLLKMDFLGIRNLSILGDAISLTNKLKNTNIVLEKIPVNDEKTFKLLAAGHTMGVFQLSGGGMTRYLMELKPTKIQDIMAMVALYRPGPMESIPEYIRRKYNPEIVSYLDPRLENILDQSYGIITYQDDVMLIAIELAGYSWLEADKLRKAMGKKIPEEMAKQKDKLLKGFQEYGKLNKDLAQKLWKLIEPFAAYGFNKAHAASYGMVAYQTAYMKANYPAIYMTSLMTNESHDLEKVAAAVKECARMGIKVLPPDINESRDTFTYIDDEQIRFGLLAIKNLGEDVIRCMIEEREENGLFVDLADFAKRIHHRAFNKKSIEALIKAGALDRFGERRQMLENMDMILMYNKNCQREMEQNQGSLFDLAPNLVEQKLRLRPAPKATSMQKLTWEKELLGLYVSEHPSERAIKLADGALHSLQKALTLPDGSFVKVCVSISWVKAIMTRKQEPMAFVGVDDVSGMGELIVFPRIYKDYKEALEECPLFFISAKVSTKDGETKLICNSMIPVREGEFDGLIDMVKGGMWITESEEIRKPKSESQNEFEIRNSKFESPIIEIKLRGKPSQDMISDLREVFQSSPGTNQVCFIIESAGRPRRIATEYAISAGNDNIEALKNIVGPDCINVVK